MMYFLRSLSRCLIVMLVGPISIFASPIQLHAKESASSMQAAAAEEIDYGPLNAQIRSAIERAKPACVAVVRRRGPNVRTAFSAVIVSAEGHVLTAGHCIEPGVEYDIILDDGRTLHAQALGRSSFLDCGLMKITEDADFPYAEMGTSIDLVRNQPCLSISHPGGYERERGLVVRFGRVVNTSSRGHIHNTCLMEPGDSGGGLFDLEGRVIGIHAYIARDLNDNFDIPVDLFRTHWQELCEPKDFAPLYAAPQFGIRVKSDQQTAGETEVAEVVKGSPADDAGLVAGDVITSINNMQLTEEYPIDRALRRSMRRRSRSVTLLVRRETETRTLEIQQKVPTYASLRTERSADHDQVARLAQNLSRLEDQLDDTAVEISSQLKAEQVESLGTIVDPAGLILSKSSCVGNEPRVTDSRGQTYTARIVSRDSDNDLVLLSVTGELPASVDLSLASESAAGSILLSPRPDSLLGLVSLRGSRSFPSPKQPSIGFLGVMLEMRDDRVVIIETPEGPAREAGLAEDDIVLKIDDQPMRTVAGMIGTIRSREPGDVVRLLIQRGDEEQTKEVTLGERPGEARNHVADHFAGGPSIRRTGFESVFCHDAHLDPKECGGPVFDLDGNFVGINVARFSRTRSYALPADVVHDAVRRMQLESEN